MEKEKRYTLTYDFDLYDDDSQYEEFDTIEELLKRYEEVKWGVCEIQAWDGNKKIAPWYKKGVKK